MNKQPQQELATTKESRISSDDKRIRLALIIPTLDEGGAEKQFSLLASQLPRERFNVQVFVLTRTGPWQTFLEQAEVQTSLIGKRFKFDPFSYFKLRQQLKDFQPHLVHTWLFAANTYGRIAAWAAGCPDVIVGERCVDLWKSWYQLAIDRRLAKKTRCFVVNSSGVKEFYQHQGIDTAKIEIIPNGIALPIESQPTAPSRDELIKQLQLPDNVKLIGAVGRLWPQKRLKDLIWATDLLNCIRDDVHLVIIGDGPQRNHLLRFAEQVEITEHVHFLGHRSDAASLIGHFDLLWHGSEYEGLSNVIMEAMAQQVPVIATDIPANRDLIEHLKTGVLVPVGDRGSFAKWTSHLFEHQEQMATMAKEAHSRISNEFRVDQMVDRHVELYTRLVQSTKSGE